MNVKELKISWLPSPKNPFKVNGMTPSLMQDFLVDIAKETDFFFPDSEQTTRAHVFVSDVADEKNHKEFVSMHKNSMATDEEAENSHSVSMIKNGKLIDIMIFIDSWDLIYERK